LNYVKPNKKEIASERMQILFQNAISNAKSNPELSQRQAALAKKICMKHKVSMPYELQISFCKKCKSFIAPGINSRIRIGRASPKAIRVTCKFCGHTYRKIIPQ